MPEAQNRPTAALSTFARTAYNFNGPVQANVMLGAAFADADGVGSRIDFKGGGRITSTGETVFSTEGGIITMTGMDVHAAAARDLLFVDGGTVHVTDSTLEGSNSGGPIYGIEASGPSADVTLDNSQLTMNSPGSAIFIGDDPPATTVTLTNGAAIAGFGSAEDSLAHIEGIPSANLTLNATDSTQSGNVLVKATDTNIPDFMLNTLNMNLSGTARWDGNVTVETELQTGLASEAHITLSDSARWRGAATNATSVTVGSGTTWTMTTDSTVVETFDSSFNIMGGTITNSGMIAFQRGGGFKTLTTVNYVGNGGTLGINTALGNNASPTDQMILTRGTLTAGTASGTTEILVTNRGGVGGLTRGNGIPVILAENGATTSPNAFSLGGPRGGVVAAGIYQYELRRGQGTTQAQQSWFLASHKNPQPNPQPGPQPVPQPVPIYRPEPSAYSVLPAMARAQSLAALGTFHERQGDQGLVRGASNDRAWGRLFAQRTEQHHTGLLGARFDGDVSGLQAGIDPLRFTDPSGYETAAGLFFAYAHSEGDAYGHNLGIPDNFAGKPELDGASVGAYWTRMSPSGAYVDAVAMATHYDSSGDSTNNVEIDADGTGLMASLEAGYLIALGWWGLTLEPQAQAIYQHLAFDRANDPFSTIDFDTPDAVVGRLGLRLTGAFGNWRPYLKANLWHDWVGEDTAVYAGVHTVDSEHASTALELGGGVVANLGPRWGLLERLEKASGHMG